MSIAATTRRRVIKWLAWSASISALLVGLIGLAHTPAGRPMLAWLASTAGCPMSLDGGDAAVVEAFRNQQLVNRRGATQERSRPALGFTLGQTTRQQAIKQLGGAARCEWSRQDTVLRCSDCGVRLDNGIQIADLHMQFDTSGTLVAVDAFHAPLSADGALARVTQRQAQLDALVGTFTARQGVIDAAHLAQGSLRRSGFEYRYRNYLARISATNFGARGVRVREQYQWIADGSGARAISTGT